MTIEVIAAEHDTFAPDLRVALRDFGSLSTQYREKTVAVRDQLEGAVQTLLAEGVGAGVIIDEDPALLSKYLFGTINWMCMWYRPSGDLRAREIGERFAGVMLTGLVAPSADGTS